jgi:2,3-dihydroxybenzoate-AMP ligase
MTLKGFVAANKEDAERHVRQGAWQNIPLSDILDAAAQECPQKEALVDNRGKLTYSQLKEQADLLSLGLYRLGIRRGDAVLLQLPNWNEFVCSFFALQKIGAPAVLLLPRHRQVEINYFCGLTQAKAWIVPERHRNTEYLPVIRDVLRTNPQLEHVITVRGKKGSGFQRIEDLTAEDGLERRVPQAGPVATDVAFVIATGGTTGLPKAVPRTHNDALCEAIHKAYARKQDGRDICMIPVPLEHNLGLAALNGIISVKGKIVLVDSTRAEDLCAAIQREKATCAPLVPTLLARLVSFDGLANYDLSSLKALYVGGAKTPVDVIKAIRNRLGNVYVAAFGMSEGPSCSTSLDDTDQVVLNSIGKPCCRFDDFKVVSPANRVLPPDTEGELLTKGPGMFSGYLDNPAENVRAFTRDGFFRTGDLAKIDKEGNIWITGRIKDIIIRGGEKISPAEVESMLREHPDVADVAVVAMPDPEMGEKACAYIQPRGKAGPGLDDIVSFLKARGASVLQLPERVELVQKIPLTKIGKADKKALEEHIKHRLERETAHEV